MYGFSTAQTWHLTNRNSEFSLVFKSFILSKKKNRSFRLLLNKKMKIYKILFLDLYFSNSSVFFLVLIINKFIIIYTHTSFFLQKFNGSSSFRCCLKLIIFHIASLSGNYFEIFLDIWYRPLFFLSVSPSLLSSSSAIMLHLSFLTTVLVIKVDLCL